MDDYRVTARFDADAQFDLSCVVEIVKAAGVPAYVEHTGGGCYTIYAGATRTDVDGDTRHAAVAGPGVMRADVYVGDWCDFYVGPDDDGDEPPFGLADLGVSNLDQIAALIVAQAVLAEPGEPLGFDAVESIGLDGTGRGIVWSAT